MKNNPVRYRVLAYILRQVPSASPPGVLQGAREVMLMVRVARKNIAPNYQIHRAPAEHLQLLATDRESHWRTIQAQAKRVISQSVHHQRDHHLLDLLLLPLLVLMLIEMLSLPPSALSPFYLQGVGRMVLMVGRVLAWTIKTHKRQSDEYFNVDTMKWITTQGIQVTLTSPPRSLENLPIIR